MSNVLEIDLMGQLSREVGDTDPGNLYYSADEIFSYLNDGLKDYNLEMPQQFGVVGTGDSAYYNPTPTEQQQRLIVLFSAKAILKGELAKQARQGVIHTNPTGRTDLSKRAEWTNMALQNKIKEIKDLKTQLLSSLVDAEMQSGNASMELRNSDDKRAEGQGITIITETV